VCAFKDLPKHGAVRVEFPGVRAGAIAVVRDGHDVYAISDECSHAEYPLSDGRVKGHRIECELHGSRFDLRTGVPDSLPAWQPVPVYPATVVDGDVYVEI
jgi:3-phenylpropionate/trans-cinnamate dioxygenase ferredoxin subunit